MNPQIMPHTKPGSSNPQMALPTGLGFETEKVMGGGGGVVVDSSLVFFSSGLLQKE